MKKTLLTLETFMGLICFITTFPRDVILSLVTLVFTLVYALGLVDPSRAPYKLNSHLMVGGMLFFILSTFVGLRMISQLNFEMHTSTVLLFTLGFLGLMQLLVLRKKFRQSS